MRSDKKFDTVKMMREIRDKLSKEFMNMSYDEQKRYIREKELSLKYERGGMCTSYNRAYLATCLRHSVQIQPYGWTSETLEPFSAMQEQEILR